MNRREFIDLLSKASLTASLSGCTNLRDFSYTTPAFGHSRLIHITDTHAQLLPIHFREPNVNLGIGGALGKVPHRVGRNLLDKLQSPTAREAHAYTYLDFTEAALRYGKVGGFAHLQTLINSLRDEVAGQALLLDGGDTWQGSATALWTRGQDMVDACNLLGVDVMTGHWEFTYQDSHILENANRFKGEFIAQNVKATEDALFEGTRVFDEDSGHVFPPYTIKTINGRRIAIVGQAFPYTPIANPKWFIPDWTFGIQEQDLADLIEEIRQNEAPHAVVLLSHNGMDVDLKLASRVSGIDFILGGHTHDGVPEPVIVNNPGGKTVVTNAGSNGKFVGVLDMAFGRTGVSDYKYRLLPVFANLIVPDPAMSAHIEKVRAPYQDKLNEPLAVSASLLYRRGNFNGTFDQLICDALRQELDAEISLSPGFRWGTSVLPGQTITMERVMDQTATTYPETYTREMSGEQIKFILESVCDNLFAPDPYYQQGGDMVRVGGLQFSCTPKAVMGKRINDLTLGNGKRLSASDKYKVAGWATVGSRSTGPDVADVVADYLRDKKTVSIPAPNEPILKGVKYNPGIADYKAELQ